METAILFRKPTFPSQKNTASPQNSVVTLKTGINLYCSPQKTGQNKPRLYVSPNTHVSHSKSLKFSPKKTVKDIQKYISTANSIKKLDGIVTKSEKKYTPSNSETSQKAINISSDASYPDLSGSTIHIKYSLLNNNPAGDNNYFTKLSNKNLFVENQKSKIRKFSFLTDKSFDKGTDNQEVHKVKSARSSPLNQSKVDLKFDDKLLLNPIDDFRIVKLLGQGTTSQVYMVQHKPTKMIFAMKCIRKQSCKNPHIQESLIREIKNLWRVKDSNVTTLYNFFSDKTHIYLILQYLKDGTLFELWKNQKRLSEKAVSNIIYDITKGINALHSRNMIHRDIKLENIFLQQGIAKIGDLGCSVETKVMRKSYIGSPNYLSPEQLSNHFYNHKIDMWSLGIMSYELLLGESPYEKKIYEIIMKGSNAVLPHLKFPQRPQISEVAKKFILRLLQQNINRRMSSFEALQDQFLKEKEIQKIHYFS